MKHARECDVPMVIDGVGESYCFIKSYYPKLYFWIFDDLVLLIFAGWAFSCDELS